MDKEARFTWYGHACIELVTAAGKVVLFDPWFGNPTSPRPAEDVDRCDVMLVSHGHHDHLGAFPTQIDKADALTIARRTGPAWPCIHEMSLWLDEVGAGDAEVIGFNKGGTVEARGVSVTMVQAQHSAGDWIGGGATAGSVYLGEPAGFVVELEDGRRIYFAGDTDVFGDMDLVRQMYRPEVAFLPIGGHYTMGPRGAARAAQMLGVRAVVPIHYGTFPVLVGTPDQLRSELARLGADVQVVAPERAEETTLP
ncbi:MAG TPA: metal-dependent hydrolase [Candidatus Limnocylindrales bacterium]|nr:metal-dependent hydrolase [Candidatus Limnocylindrales bacterium]